MASIEAGEARRFDAGRVVRDVFGVIGRNAAPFAAASLIFCGAPQMLMGWGQIRTASADGAFNWFAFAAIGIGFLGLLVGGTVAQVAYIKVVVADLTGRPTTMRAACDDGVRIFWPALALTIASGLGIGMATLVLIVPGLYVATMWAVAMPALAMERPDYTRALNRSQALTRGHRWPVFGLLVVAVVGYTLLFGLVGALGVAFGAQSVSDDRTLVGVAASTLSSMLGTLLLTASGAALYVELCRVKEGDGVDQLTAVFE